MKKKNLALVLLLAICLVTVPVLAKVFWTRTVTKTLTIVGINAELLEPSVDGHTNKWVATELTPEDKIAITIYEENYYEIWLNLSWQTDLQDLIVSASGQYYHCFVFGGYGNYDPVGSAFNIPMDTQYTVDKLNMMYGTSEDGYMLEITFAWDTEACFELGDFDVALNFAMGFL